MSTSILSIILVVALLACCLVPMLLMRKRDRSAPKRDDEGTDSKPKPGPPP